MGLAKSSRYSGVERRVAKPSPKLVAAAILGVLGITYATLCPIELRPQLGSADEERFGAYFALGVIVSLVAPRRAGAVFSLLVLLAFGLEAAQRLVPGRHGEFADACVKATGGVCGAQLGFASFALRRWLERATRPLNRIPARVAFRPRRPGWRALGRA